MAKVEEDGDSKSAPSTRNRQLHWRPAQRQNSLWTLANLRPDLVSIDYQVFRMTARIFLTNVWAGPKFGKEISCGKYLLREDSGLFLPEFGHRRDEPSDYGN
jgi:hypothetical protein